MDSSSHSVTRRSIRFGAMMQRRLSSIRPAKPLPNPHRRASTSASTSASASASASPTKPAKPFANFRLRRDSAIATVTSTANRRHTADATTALARPPLKALQPPALNSKQRNPSPRTTVHHYDVYDQRPASGDNKSSIASSSSSENPLSDFDLSPLDAENATSFEDTSAPYATPETHHPLRRVQVQKSPPPQFVLPPNETPNTPESPDIPEDTPTENKENRVTHLKTLFQNQDTSPPAPHAPTLSLKYPLSDLYTANGDRSRGQSSQGHREVEESHPYFKPEDNAVRSPNIGDLVAKFENGTYSPQFAPSPISPQIVTSNPSTPLYKSVQVALPSELSETASIPKEVQVVSGEADRLQKPTNSRAERVANALELICDRIDDYAWHANKDGNAPREAIIPLMIESMRQHRNHCTVADRALNTLRKLTVSDDCRARIGESGGIEAIVGIMRCHSLLIRIQTQSCLILANLTFQNDRNKEEVFRCGGFQAVIAAMLRHWSHVHVQMWGCLALRNFTNFSSLPKQDAFVAVEAVGVLLCALERNPNSAMVQQHSLTALVNIARMSPIGLERILREGGICTLIVCMRNNLRSTKLCELALCLVRLIVVDKKNQKVIGYSNGIEAVTAIMEEHRGVLGIAIKGCTIFRHLACVLKNRDQLEKCDSIRSITLAMKDHMDAGPETMSVFLKALGNSTYDSLANKTLAGRLGGISNVLKVLSDPKHRDNESIVQDGCRALRNLVDGVAQNHGLMVKHKGIAIVLDAVRLHGMHSAGVVEHGIAIFVNMSSNKAFAHQLNEGSGDIAQVARNMKNAHAGNEAVGRQTSTLLESIGLSHSGRLATQGSGVRDLRMYATKDRSTLRGSASHHRFADSDDEPGRRLQRLRSVPLPLSKYRQDLSSGPRHV